MKAGDLVQAPWLMDHERKAIGVLIKFQDDQSSLVAFANNEGMRVVPTHLLMKVRQCMQRQ